MPRSCLAMCSRSRKRRWGSGASCTCISRTAEAGCSTPSRALGRCAGGTTARFPRPRRPRSPLAWTPTALAGRATSPGGSPSGMSQTRATRSLQAGRHRPIIQDGGRHTPTQVQQAGPMPTLVYPSSLACRLWDCSQGCSPCSPLHLACSQNSPLRQACSLVPLPPPACSLWCRLPPACSLGRRPPQACSLAPLLRQACSLGRRHPWACSLGQRLPPARSLERRRPRACSPERRRPRACSLERHLRPRSCSLGRRRRPACSRHPCSPPHKRSSCCFLRAWQHPPCSPLLPPLPCSRIQASQRPPPLPRCLASPRWRRRRERRWGRPDHRPRQ